ncbi:MAG: nuclear transport factor 2 family protein [Sphingomonadales bacterium]|nr:nuclear transport factor 2 family protein [Sphingomonadales bacterium]
MSETPFDRDAALRDYVARQGITDALHRYLRGLDRLDPALTRSAFTADAFVDCGLMAGPADAFVAFALDLLGAMEASHHLMGQARIELHGEATASGEVYFQAWQATRNEAGEPRDLFIAGRYVDEYACDNGEWRIRRRHLITDWTRDEPADRSFLESPTTNRGARRGEDFSERRTWPA